MQRNAKTHLSKTDSTEFQQRWRALKSSWDVEVGNHQFEELCDRFAKAYPTWMGELRKKRCPASAGNGKWRPSVNINGRGRMRKERKHYSSDEKVAILRRHLLDKVPVSDLCEELGLRPTVFYRWQKEFFENGAAAFQSKQRHAIQVEEKQKRIEFLGKKVQTKYEVLAELMAEHIALKKSLGEL
jgi:transposase-like protein